MKFFTAILFLTFLHGFVFSQKHNFKHYSIDEGLPQASVYCVYQDPKGYLWLGTQGGVAKFDGQEFENYNQKDGLAENHVTAILQDSFGNTWFGHRYEGISILKDKNILSQKGKIKEMKEQVSCFFQIGDYLLIGTKGNGVFAIEIASISDQQLRYTHIKKDSGLESDFIFDFFQSENGNIWIATGNGIYSLSKDLNKNSIKKMSSLNDVFSNSVYDIETGVDNSVWISSVDGIYKVHNPLDNSISKFTKKYSGTKKDGRERKIILDKEGSVWFTAEGGAGKIEGDNLRFFKEENGLTDFEITSISLDREGSIWFGLMGDGIYQYIGEAFVSWGVENGLSSKIAQAIMVDNNNNVWIGTEKGLSIINQNGAIKSLFENNGLTDNNIQTLFQDSRNLIWIGTRRGISVFDPATEKILKLTKNDGLAANLNITINEDKNGDIWTGSLGEGTSQIIMNSKNVSKIVKYYREDSFSSNAVWKIFRDSKDNLWFGTNDVGLIKYDGFSFTTINDKDGLPNQRPGSITEDKQGNLWIGSIGGGVIKFNPASNTFKSFTTKEGIGSDNPYLVICDNKNNVWVGTNYGIDRINEQGKIKHFGKNEGF